MIVRMIFLTSTRETILIMGEATYYENIRVSADVAEIELPWSVEDTEPGAGVWKRYAPGLTTWTIHVDEYAVFTTTDKPQVLKLVGGAMYTWHAEATV